MDKTPETIKIWKASKALLKMLSKVERRDMVLIVHEALIAYADRTEFHRVPDMNQTYTDIMKELSQEVLPDS